MAPDKSACYLVDDKWIQGKWKCTNPGYDNVLEATNKTIETPHFNILRQMKQYSCWECILHQMAIKKNQVKYMHRKVTTW